MNSPFKFGGIVSEKAFTNREKECKRLSDNLRNGIHTIMISPRRWGKSSLVEKVSVGLEKEGVKCIVIDLNAAGTAEEFLELLAKETIKASSNKFEDWVKATQRFFSQLIPKINFGPIPETDFTLSFDWKELRKNPDEILNLPERLAKKQQCRYVICIDEFQNLAEFPDYADFEKKMRAIWQRHRYVSYCLYGSKSHMMAQIFNHVSKPFYRFGDVVHLSKISLGKWETYITRSFTDSGKQITVEDAKAIIELMDCHSWYVQQMAHYVWLNTTEKVSSQNIKTALNDIIAASTPFFQQTIEQLTPSRINLIKAIAKGENQFYSERIKHNYRLGTPNLIRKNFTNLIEAGIIHKSEKNYLFLDPVFEIWFKQLYLGEALPL
jgi:AAA+ ATPase superfamily predicted ATPase